MSDPARAIDTIGAAPFAIGDLIYERRRPENGSLTVRAVEWTCGYWRVEATAEIAPGLAAIFTSAPAEDFARCPLGWREPPPCPAESLGYDAASEVRRAELREDEIYQTRLRKWGDAVRRWKRAVLGG